MLTMTKIVSLSFSWFDFQDEDDEQVEWKRLIH